MTTSLPNNAVLELHRVTERRRQEKAVRMRETTIRAKGQLRVFFSVGFAGLDRRSQRRAAKTKKSKSNSVVRFYSAQESELVLLQQLARLDVQSQDASIPAQPVPSRAQVPEVHKAQIFVVRPGNILLMTNRPRLPAFIATLVSNLTRWTLSGAEGIALLTRQLMFALISGRTANAAMALYHPMQ
ncbi:hypothetical protein B0H13DRAFT_1890822 [Mycena leptocephala]|nr:hypothetical protein B0H13DRAFT_1890822 [Mycena leptocephala]